MKTHPLLFSIILVVICPFILHGSSSSNYAINMQGITNGGGQVGSASYVTNSSIGGIGGIGGTLSPDIIARSGFAGQLFEIDSVDVSVSPEFINEDSSGQLSAVVNLDDGTMLNPGNTEVEWTKIDGPISPPSPIGLVHAQLVYANQFATVGGTYGGVLGTKLIAIINSNADNYEAYGGDGIDDDWQVSYFGEPPNTDADPSANPDGDADNNEMEFLAGFDPTDPNEWFQLTFMEKTGSVASLQLNKVIPDRIYTIQTGTDLDSFPQTITTLNPVIEAFDVTVTDPNATEERKFYRVDVTRP